MFSSYIHRKIFTFCTDKYRAFIHFSLCVSNRFITGLRFKFLMPLWISKPIPRLYVLSDKCLKSKNIQLFFFCATNGLDKSVVNANRSFFHEHHSEFRWDMSASASKLSPKYPLSVVSARYSLRLFDDASLFGIPEFFISGPVLSKSTFQAFRWLAKKAIETRAFGLISGIEIYNLKLI